MTTLLAVLCVVAVGRWRRIAGLLPPRRLPSPDPVVVAGLVSVGLHAGLSLRGALATAADTLGPSAQPIRRVLREGALTGTGHALAAATGPLAGLLRRLAEAERTGAPVLATIGAFEREHEAQARARMVERARKLPIRLTVPLTLLVLPGSVLALLGPTVLELLARAIAP